LIAEAMNYVSVARLNFRKLRVERRQINLSDAVLLHRQSKSVSIKITLKLDKYDDQPNMTISFI